MQFLEKMLVMLASLKALLNSNSKFRKENRYKVRNQWVIQAVEKRECRSMLLCLPFCKLIRTVEGNKINFPPAHSLCLLLDLLPPSTGTAVCKCGTNWFVLEHSHWNDLPATVCNNNKLHNLYKHAVCQLPPWVNSWQGTTSRPTDGRIGRQSALAFH